MTQPVVLVVGSLHYDIMVQTTALPGRDETAVGSRWYPKFGGKGGNQAVAAQKAGVAARMCGAIGEDDFGYFLRQTLRASGVEDRFVSSLTAVGSGMSVAIVDAKGDYAATIVSGANLLISQDALDEPTVWNNVAILLLQNEVPEAVNLAAARQARMRGIPTVLNAAPFRPMSHDFCALVDILVVNRVEAEMMGTDPVVSLQTAADAALKLARHFPAVIVTAGAEGLAAWSATDEAIVVPAKKVKVASSHGAGDAFTGTLASRLARGDGFEAACHAASAVAAQFVAGLSLIGGQ